MNCREARDLLLEADLADLAPGAGSELAAHLETCTACRRAAARIVGVEGALARRLTAVRPTLEESAAVARAVAAARRRATVRRIGFGTLAAAAAAAGILLLPARQVSRPSLPAVGPAAPVGFSVTASPAQSLVVLQPADSNIVVVWYLTSRRSS